MKFTPEYGKVSFTITQEKITKKDALIRFTIADNGIGISKEDLPKIWNRFYRADASRSETEGFGLGLALVKKIAEIHSAECFAESEIDKFTEIRIIFKKI